MKKIFAFLFAVLMLFAFAGCGNSPEVNDAEAAVNAEAAAEAADAEEESEESELAHNEYRLVSYFFEGYEEEKIHKSMEYYGISDYTINEDRSVTFRLNAIEKKKVIDHNREELIHYFETLSTNTYEADYLECITRVELSDDYKNIYVYVDEIDYSSYIPDFVSFAKEQLLLIQTLSGVAPKEMSITTSYMLDKPLDVKEFVLPDYAVEELIEATEPESSEAPEEAIEERMLVDGDDVYIDGVCEFKVLGWDHADKIVRGGMQKATGCKGESNTNLWVLLEVNNISTEELEVTANLRDGSEEYFPQKAELVYDGMYSYTGGSASWGDLLPLSTEEVYVLYYVPKNIIDAEDSMVVHFTIAGYPFAYTIR